MGSNIGLLFPGQGAQSVGMGRDLYEQFVPAREVYDRASDILGIDIRRISFDGPEEELRQTRYTQPAILVHSLAVLAALPTLEPVAAAGHSLGEYSALFAAGALDFETVLRLVKRRGELMFAEGEKNPGTMAAVIGLDATAVRAACAEAGGVVAPANYNEPKQTVISGEVDAVERAAELARGKGALKVVMLPVSGAFHSPLLAESAASFAGELDRARISDPRFPVVANVTAEPVRTAAEVRAALSRQLTSPVRWVETIAALRSLGCARCFEVGPGQVLAGLVKRTDRELPVTPAGKVTDIAALAVN
jgi:[acyl-carrier-protein] S-malonyltransferase